MKQQELDTLLRNQYLIVSFIDMRLQLVNRIMGGYEHNEPVLMDNRFLHFSAHAFYRSIVVDLHALYGQAASSHKNSLFWIERKANGLLELDAITNVKQWLQEKSDEIQTIKELRDKQLAHYDFTIDPSIHVNFNALPIVNILHRLAKQIIAHCSHRWINEELRTGYIELNDNDYLHDLQELIEKAAR